MDKHALGILEAAGSWDWPLTPRNQESGTKQRCGKFKAITPKLLSGFLTESVELGGTLVDQFWKVVAACHPYLGANVEQLRQIEFISPSQSEQLLFQGVARESINFKPVFEMAGEFFTHLGVALVNPGGRKSAAGTPFSVSDTVHMETDELLKCTKEKGFGQRNQASLKALCLRRDGQSCPFTGASFDENGVDPILAHIIPNSIHNQPDTLKCIAMFAGPATRELVINNLNDVKNVMNIEGNAQTAYDKLKWGIEAKMIEGKVKYIYRRVPCTDQLGPGYITLRDGEDVKFGMGPEANRIGSGPDPLLCNLQLAVARVLKMSGAAELIAQMAEDADDSDFPHVYLVSDQFCDILTAKLLMLGQALPF